MIYKIDNKKLKGNAINIRLTIEGEENKLHPKLETKNKHIHVLMKPSILELLDDFANSNYISRNEAISMLIERGTGNDRQH